MHCVKPAYAACARRYNYVFFVSRFSLSISMDQKRERHVEKHIKMSSNALSLNGCGGSLFLFLFQSISTKSVVQSFFFHSFQSAFITFNVSLMSYLEV